LNAITVQFANELAATGNKVNSACPSWVKTDMGTEAAPRTVAQGARVMVHLATPPPDGPTGGFFDENAVVSW
jgi:NAD(P)-dependent dehydrogenase (short-subunit alcohol dehydrogenase family)